jgi:hypothetical protein
MQLAAEQEADTIRAQLNYIVDTGVPPVNYIDWPEMAHKANPPQYRQHEMTIRNGRPLRDTSASTPTASCSSITRPGCRTSPTRPSASASTSPKWRR